MGWFLEVFLCSSQQKVIYNQHQGTRACGTTRSPARAGHRRSLSILLPPCHAVGQDATPAAVALGNSCPCTDISPLHVISLFLPRLARVYGTSQLLRCKMLWEWRGLGTSQESLASHRRELLSLGEAFYKSKINACISIAI